MPVDWTLESTFAKSVSRAEKDAVVLVASKAMGVIKTAEGNRAVEAARSSHDPTKAEAGKVVGMDYRKASSILVAKVHFAKVWGHGYGTRGDDDV